MAEVDNKQLPEIPTKRPKQIHDKKLKKGRRRTQKHLYNCVSNKDFKYLHRGIFSIN